MSVPGLNVSGRRLEWPAGRPAESVETLWVGFGGTWQPRHEGFLPLYALESRETLRKVAAVVPTSPRGLRKQAAGE
jgi:hypothetical protein